MAPPHPRSLPVRLHKDRIVDKVQLNRVTLIIADTGSGKSSQVPQMLLEEGLAPVLCTQPRRLAVVSISRLVAQERGCHLGEEVGYHIGQKKVISNRSKIVFETAGVLLEELRCEGPKALSRYKVVILDEVHERSIESDLVLTCIKQFMLRNVNIRLVLMSATFDCARYKDYFKDLDKNERVEIIPVLNSSRQWNSVQFNCKVHYLEDVLELLGKNEDCLGNSVSTLMPSEKGNDIGLENQRIIADLIVYLHNNELDLNKSVLVFLPTYKALEKQWSLLKGLGLDLRIYVLHSSIDMDHCIQAMEVSHSMRKVILATNVAESSVTIPGASYVIDSCRSLEICWDNLRKKCIPRLVWVSKSQAEQRKGRTGRTCDGEVFRMVRKDMYYAFAEFETPAIQLLSLREQVLMINCAGSKAINDPIALFSKTMDPPNQLTVENALDTLQSIEALRISQQKGKYLPTSYGKLLASLPLSLQSAVLVVRGGQVGLLRETAVIAALMDASPFPIVHPFGHEIQFRIHLEMYYQRQASHCGEIRSFSRVSVLLANLHAYEFWQCALKDKQRLERLIRYGSQLKNVDLNEFTFLEAGEQLWCAQHYISSSALYAIAETCDSVIEKMHCFRPKFLNQVQEPPAYYTAYDFQHTCEFFPDQENLMENIILQEDDLSNEVEPEVCFKDHFVSSEQFHTAEDLETLKNLIGEVQREFLQGNSCTEDEEDPLPDENLLCRFFQRGVCTKGSACHFSHDFTAKPSYCKYFMTASGCRYGELCEFRHGRNDQNLSINNQPIEFEEDSPTVESLLNILPSCKNEGDCQEIILIYGEDDFTFTENLSEHCKTAEILAISAGSMEKLAKANVKDRVSRLSEAGIKIVWNVNINSLLSEDANVIPWSKVACILWTINIGSNDETMTKSFQDFFSWLSVTLLSQGVADISVLLTMYNNQYSKWQVDRVARDCFFFLVQSMPFDMNTFGVYSHSENRDSLFSAAKPVTYVFDLVPPSASLHGDYFWYLQQAFGG